MKLNIVRTLSALVLILTVTIGVPFSTQNSHIRTEVLSASSISNQQAQINIFRQEKTADETPIAGNSAETLEVRNQQESTQAAQLQLEIESEQLKQKIKQEKVLVVQQLLIKHNSPMVDNAQDFVEAAEQYNLDWRLVVSISGVESTFGKHIAPNTFNPFGWGGGYIKFSSWREAIYTVSKGLSENYVADGLDTPLKMQRRYAPPSSTWGSKVNYFMQKLAINNEA